MGNGVELPDGTGLRTVAETSLSERAAPPTRGWPVGTDALVLLYRLASQSDTASDALKLLHELQVHQVELDLLYAEIEEREAAMARDLQRYQTAFEFAPVAYLLVSGEGVIEEANRACAGLLDTDPAALVGQCLENLLTESSRAALGDLLQTLRAGEPVAVCEVERSDGRPGTVLRMQGAAAPVDGSSFMVVVS